MSVNVPITNGKGSVHVVPGTYGVAGTAVGYMANTLEPTSVTIADETSEYSFTIEASGTLTLHVTDDGTELGVQVVGATFQRCDAEGNTYGSAVTTNGDGDAVFEHVPFSTVGDAPKVYFKQLNSDEGHTFNSNLQETSLTASTATVQIQNPEANTKNFNLTDKHYDGLPVADGNLVLTAQ